MNKLTGFRRMQLTKEWLKRGKPDVYKEIWIKKVCEAKNWEYTPPITINRKADK